MRLNETTKTAQQEIAFPARPETSHSERDRAGPNSIPVDRKGTPFIGQTFSYTDSPSNDFSYSKGASIKFSI